MAYCIVIQTLNKTETGVYHLWETIAPPPGYAPGIARHATHVQKV